MTYTSFRMHACICLYRINAYAHDMHVSLQKRYTQTNAHTCTNTTKFTDLSFVHMCIAPVHMYIYIYIYTYIIMHVDLGTSITNIQLCCSLSSIHDHAIESVGRNRQAWYSHANVRRHAQTYTDLWEKLLFLSSFADRHPAKTLCCKNIAHACKRDHAYVCRV
jgi:hypothetical protein